MTAISTVDEVRLLGRLPGEDFLATPDISPHLASAARELYGWIGDYSGSTGDKLAACKEAEQCLCIARLLPVLNTLYTDASMYAQREIGESGFAFHAPEDQEKIIDRWRDRAKLAVSAWTESSGTKQRMSWYAV